jgi:sporulation protein YlmC with PRC-barrel domain
MEYEVNSLVGCSMAAKDGIIGKVEDFYFDDERWTIRYLIVKTGNWLSERKVLISTNALTKASWKGGLLPVNLTIEQIQNSPDMDWVNYWEDGYYLGVIWSVAPVFDKEGLIERNKPDEQSQDDQHLRSCNQVSGYHVHAIDGEIGHIKDFIFDDKTSQLKFVVVDTHNWFGGKKVLLDIKKITEVEWNNSKVFVDMTINSVKNSLEFDELKFILQKTSKIVQC